MSDYGFDEYAGLSPPIKVWAEPEQDQVYVAGVDTAEGLGHGDQACIQMLNVRNGEQCANYTERIPPDLLAVVVERMARWYKGALVVVEANNHGLVTINALRQLGYRSLFRRRQINRLYQRVTEEYGFKTTRNSKPMIINELDEAMRNGEVILHEHETFVELRGYVRDERGSMGGSPFDDRVMALALANHGRQHVHLREAEDEKTDDYMSFAWWRRQGEPDDSDRLVVGAHARRRGPEW